MVTRTWKLSLVVLASLALMGMGSNAFAADKPVSFGVQGNWGEDSDFGVGARAIIDLGEQVENLELVGSFDYYFPSTGDEFEDLGVDTDVTYWEINANAIYKFELSSSSLVPYAGAGLNYAHGGWSVNSDIVPGILDESGSESEVGLNILGGVLFGTGKTKLFFEAKFELEGGEQFVVTGGIRF